MRAVVQRVRRAHVDVAGETVGRIEQGLVAFVGAAKDDGQADLDYLANKLIGLRIFADESGKMTKALRDIGGSLLIISQFTVFGDVRRGLRPSFDDAMEPVSAEATYERFVALCRNTGVHVETGRFRADMQVHVENDGPVTILLDSRKTF